VGVASILPFKVVLANPDSVAANIAFGVNANEIDHQAVERAARIANLHEFVVTELPQGYATTVGERGVRLSGGQRHLFANRPANRSTDREQTV
jgi:ABC-type multidrug transport system fused ATPase/permease subunit